MKDLENCIHRLCYHDNDYHYTLFYGSMVTRLIRAQPMLEEASLIRDFILKIQKNHGRQLFYSDGGPV